MHMLVMESSAVYCFPKGSHLATEPYFMAVFVMFFVALWSVVFFMRSNTVSPSWYE